MYQELDIKREEITFGFDSVVVRKFTNGVYGGVTLDITNYPESTVIAGQVVITDGEVYKPMPINGDFYGEMPEGFKYFGVIYRSSRADVGVSVMTRGSINKYRVPYNFEAIKDAFAKDCPYIILACDCEQMEEYARLEASDGVVLTREGKEIWFRVNEGGENYEGV